MKNATINAVSTPATKIFQIGELKINAKSVGNGRTVIKVYLPEGCKPSSIATVAAEMPERQNIIIFSTDRRNNNYNNENKRYDGRYDVEIGAYIFTDMTYGSKDYRKTYKFATAEEAIRKMTREEVAGNEIINTVEVDAAEYAISEDALNAAVEAEIENANKADEVTTVEVETPVSVAEPTDENTETTFVDFITYEVPKNELNIAPAVIQTVAVKNNVEILEITTNEIHDQKAVLGIQFSGSAITGNEVDIDGFIQDLNSIETISEIAEAENTDEVTTVEVETPASVAEMTIETKVTDDEKVIAFIGGKKLSLNAAVKAAIEFTNNGGTVILNNGVVNINFSEYVESYKVLKAYLYNLKNFATKITRHCEVEINGEFVIYHNGKAAHIYSDKYSTGANVDDGKITRYCVYNDDEGTKATVETSEEFFQIMSERGHVEIETVDGYDEEAFALLPNVDELNDVDGEFAEPEIVTIEIETPADVAEFDEDAEAEKFLRNTAKTFGEFKDAIYHSHKILVDNLFDIFPFDHDGKTYSIKLFDQAGKLKAEPNKYHLVDTRFDVYVDRADLDFNISYGFTLLARYTTAYQANKAVNMLIDAIARRDGEFTFPTFGETLSSFDPTPENTAEPNGNDAPQGWIVPTEVPARKLSDVEIADLLTDRLCKATCKRISGSPYLDVTLQNGKKTVTNLRTATVEPNWHGNGFVFIAPWNEVYARYDTAEKTAVVINLIEQALKRGDTEFTYPANEPPDPVNAQTRAIDLDVYHADSNLTGEELADYTIKLREALTANGNKGIVTCEDNVITVIGYGGGDNKRLAELLKEMCERGCAVEVVDDEADERSEMTGWELDELAALGTNTPQGEFVITDPTVLPPSEEGSITRDYCDKINVNAPDGWEIRYIGERKISGSRFTNAVLYIFHNNQFVTEFKDLLSSKFVKNPAAFFATFDETAPVDVPAPVTVEVPTPEFITEPVKEFAFNVARFNDDFIAQRDELKANVRIAHDALVVAQDNFDDAENALRKFFNKAAYALCEDFQQAQTTLGDKKIIIERQSGSRGIISADTDIYIDIHGGETFAFVDGNDKTIARYDTPAQVKAVINKFTAAIANGDKEFTFPPVEELNA